MKFVATCFQGIEDLLFRELCSIGASNVKKSKRSVYFTGDYSTLYKANYQLRTAIRVLLELGEYKIQSFSDLYNHVYNIEWDNIFDMNQSFAVSAVCYSRFFKDTRFVALKTKDAIADYFRNKYHKRPNVNPKNPDIHIHIYINEHTLYIHLNSSGESLHKRGYKTHYQAEAPMSEVLAAALVQFSGWSKEQPLYNPMCGSGTIGLEACFQALNMSPQIKRNHFSFFNWKDFDSDLWSQVKNTMNSPIPAEPFSIICSDIKDYEVLRCQKNVTALSFEKYFKVYEEDYFESRITERPLTLIINPPYDKRISLQNAIAFYQHIGDTLKQKFKNCEAWIFSGNKEAIKHVGLKPSRKINLYNGPIESKFHKFELY